MQRRFLSQEKTDTSLPLLHHFLLLHPSALYDHDVSVIWSDYYIVWLQLEQGGGLAVKLKGANHSESELTLFKLSKTLHLVHKVKRRRGEL